MPLPPAQLISLGDNYMIEPEDDIFFTNPEITEDPNLTFRESISFMMSLMDKLSDPRVLRRFIEVYMEDNPELTLTAEEHMQRWSGSITLHLTALVNLHMRFHRFASILKLPKFQPPPANPNVH